MFDLIGIWVEALLVMACWLPQVSRALRGAGLYWLAQSCRILIAILLATSALVLAAERAKPVEIQNWDAPMGGSFAFMLVSSALGLILLVWSAVARRDSVHPQATSGRGEWALMPIAVLLAAFVCSQQTAYLYPAARYDFLVRFAPSSRARKDMEDSSISRTLPVALPMGPEMDTKTKKH